MILRADGLLQINTLVFIIRNGVILDIISPPGMQTAIALSSFCPNWICPLQYIPQKL
jgi:hypothetical protein